MAYAVPDLAYAFDALEPHIDARTMEIHHDKHHAAYVTNLNAALEGTGLGDQPIEQLIANLDQVPEEKRTSSIWLAKSARPSSSKPWKRSKSRIRSGLAATSGPYPKNGGLGVPSSYGAACEF